MHEVERKISTDGIPTHIYIIICIIICTYNYILYTFVKYRTWPMRVADKRYIDI